MKKKLKLTTAILKKIDQFDNQEFSIWDITDQIRKDVKNDEYDLDETSGNTVWHDKVKDIFEEYLNEGVVDLSLVGNTHGYRLFKNNRVKSNPNIIDNTQGRKTFKNNLTKPNSNQQTVISPDDQLKIYKYINNKGSVTIKMIQSSMKGKPYTCQDIKNYLVALGVVDSKDSRVSALVVKL